MADIIGNVLKLACGLLQTADRLTAAQNSQRAEVAHLFDRVSGYLADFSCRLRRGEAPFIGCATLLVSLQTIARLFPAGIANSGAQDLLTALTTELSAPGALETWAREIDESGHQQSLADQVEEVAGKFLTLAAMTRWRLDSIYQVFVRPSEIETEALARLGKRLGLPAEELAHAALFEFLQTTPEFKDAAEYVIQKNRTLHGCLR